MFLNLEQTHTVCAEEHLGFRLEVFRNFGQGSVVLFCMTFGEGGGLLLPTAFNLPAYRLIPVSYRRIMQSVRRRTRREIV